MENHPKLDGPSFVVRDRYTGLCYCDNLGVVYALRMNPQDAASVRALSVGGSVNVRGDLIERVA